MANRQRRFVAAARQVGKPQASDFGPGSPVHLMSARVVALVRRMRNTLSFPMPIDEFLMTVYPEQLFKPIPNREEHPWANLAACLHVGDIAHFGIEGRGEHDTFWVRHPANIQLPVPADASATLTFHKNNPHFTKVSAWVNEALATQFDLAAVAEKAMDFIRTAKHPYHVEQYWPELWKCVGGAIEGRVRDPIPKINTRALELPIQRTREEITTTLVKCSMLPEKVCQAWVQYPREDS